MAACSTASGLFPPGAKPAIKKKWVTSARLYIGTIRGIAGTDVRVLCEATPVDETGHLIRPVRVRMMDCVTGSVYDRGSGRCLSSDTLRLVGAERKQAGAERVLMAMRASEP